MYKLVKEKNDSDASVVYHTTKNAWIPKDPANTDYQAYLAWVAEGNTPEPAEENT